MPQETFDNYIGQLLSKYQYPERAKRDVCRTLHQYGNLFAKLDTYVFNDGNRQELVCLEGTIPVRYKGTFYNIPVSIWLLDTHPFNSPMCYVKPTPDMRIKVSRYVDVNGRIYLPYLHDWNPSSSELLSLIQVMIIVFGETPPLYSKPKMEPSPATYAPPYPAQPSSFMPMPNVGTPYPAFNPVPASTAYPSATPVYPAFAASYPPVSGYPYPAYNSATGTTAGNGYPPVSTVSYPAVPVPAGATPAPAVPTPASSTVQQQSNMGTISEEHIHASLLSAVEDKLKKRLREVLAQSQAEIEVLKKTQDDLTKGKATLEDMLNRIKNEQREMDKNISILREKNDEISELLNKSDCKEDVEIDDAVTTTAPLYKQLLNTFAEESATEDAIYYLGEALRKGVVDLDLFLKHVRHLSRKQFMLRALMQKCRQKANLSH